MKISATPIATIVYKAYLHSRLKRYRRDLHSIALQRENDFQAERILHREVIEVRSKLNAL